MAGFAILQDTREQSPYRFSGCDVEVITATLPAGDYSLAGFGGSVGIERKSVDDLVGCLKGDERVRFEKELGKLRFYDFACVVVEGSLADLLAGRYRSQMTPQSVVQSVLTFMQRYRLSFVFAGDRATGELVTLSLLQKYAREIGERYRTLRRAERLEPA